MSYLLIPSVIVTVLLISILSPTQAESWEMNALTPWPEITFKSQGVHLMGSGNYGRLRQHGHHRQRRSTIHADHPHTRNGRCFGGGSSDNGQSSGLPGFDIRFGNQPQTYRTSSNTNPTGLYPFAYRILGQN